MKRVTVLAVAACAAGAAQANVIDARSIQASAVQGVELIDISQDPVFANVTKAFAGDQYLHVPAIGSAAGLAIAGTGLTATTFNFVDQIIGPSLGGGNVTASEAFSTDVPNPSSFGQTGVLQLDLLGSNLFPGGFNLGGLPATRAGQFMGVNAGGSPLINDNPVIITSARWYLFNAAGNLPLGGFFDILSIVPVDGDGYWTGSLGVALNNSGTGLGIVQGTFLLEYVVVPAPSGMAMLLTGGLFAARRRR